MKRVVVFLVAFCLASPALARNITSEVQYYNDIEVSFSEHAHVCGLSDPGPIKALAKERLSAMDVPYNPDGLVKVVILVTARGSGLLKQSCTAHLGLQLQSQMNSQFLDVNAYEGDDQTFVMMSQREYTFPMVFYQTGRVFSELAPTTPDKALEILGLLLDDLSAARALR